LHAIDTVDSDDAFANAIAAGAKPCVLRGACGNWELVQAGIRGDGAVLDYLRERVTQAPVCTVVGAPGIAGRFAFNPSFTGVNYEARQTPLGAVLPHLLPQAHGGGHAIAVQAAPVRQVLRDWDAGNNMPFLPPDTEPTLWLGNRGRVAPHSDVHDNLAVVGAGKRCFTLFPPEQIDNLYLGPLLNSPGGVPVTAVDLWSPDFARYPRFRDALASASTATLLPGDALFIPALWWHGVEAQENLNVLVNFWWGGVTDTALSPYDALRHSILALAALPREKRARWLAYYQHLAFRLAEEPGSHLPESLADLLTQPDGEQVKSVVRQLQDALGATPHSGKATD
jgi:hypothetical protein